MRQADIQLENAVVPLNESLCIMAKPLDTQEL